MKKIDIPFVLLILSILSVFIIVSSVISNSNYSETILFLAGLCFLPLSVLILVVYKIFTHANTKLFWIVLILNILLFAGFYVWFQAANSFYVL